VDEVVEKEDIDGPSGTPLHAAAAGRREEVLLLLAHGADVTVKNSEKYDEGDSGKERDDMNKRPLNLVHLPAYRPTTAASHSG
jgi:ankyrin repeat protein